MASPHLLLFDGFLRIRKLILLCRRMIMTARICSYQRSVETDCTLAVCKSRQHGLFLSFVRVLCNTVHRYSHTFWF